MYGVAVIAGVPEARAIVEDRCQLGQECSPIAPTMLLLLMLLFKSS